MLSPHEFSALMLVNVAPDQIGLDREEIHTLMTHQLVSMEVLPTGQRQFSITTQGRDFLKAAGLIR